MNLKKSYRTTIEITNNANKVLKQMNLNEAEPVIRHGSEIKFENCAKNIQCKINRIQEWINKGYKTIAVICKTDKEATDIYNALSKCGIDITHIKATDKVYNENNMDDMHLLYVVITRALHELEILYDNNLCPVFDESKEKTFVKK